MSRNTLRQTLATIVFGLTMVVPSAASAQVITSVWYRGLPSGVPRYVDLEAIRANGFTAVTWPLQHVNGAMELQRMASTLGLTVVVRSESVPLTFALATQGESKVDVLVPRTPPGEWTALIWRAVAHGARVVSFDAGLAQGTGLWDETGTPDWVPVAVALSRQLTTNGSLVASLRRGPAVTIEQPVPALDVSLLENARSWVIIATNASTTTGKVIDTTAVFPPQVPAAEWLSLFDGNMMSMLYRATGSRWHVRLGPGEAKVFVIDKRDPVISRRRQSRRTESRACWPCVGRILRTPARSRCWPCTAPASDRP